MSEWIQFGGDVNFLDYGGFFYRPCEDGSIDVWEITNVEEVMGAEAARERGPWIVGETSIHPSDLPNHDQGSPYGVVTSAIQTLGLSAEEWDQMSFIQRASAVCGTSWPMCTERYVFRPLPSDFGDEETRSEVQSDLDSWYESVLGLPDVEDLADDLAEMHETLGGVGVVARLTSEGGGCELEFRTSNPPKTKKTWEAGYGRSAWMSVFRSGWSGNQDGFTNVARSLLEQVKADYRKRTERY